MPSKLCWCVTIVCKDQTLRSKHFHTIFVEVELEQFFAQFKTDWIRLCRHQEVEGSVVDVVCDGSAEGFYCLTAEDDVKACLLTWRNHLAQRSRHLEFGISIYHQSNIDVLTKIIRYNERFCGLTLHKNVFEVDVGWANSYFLELLTSEFSSAVFKLSLSYRFCLKLTLDQLVYHRLFFRSHFVVVLGWLIFIDRSLNIKWFDGLIGLKPWFSKVIAHSEIEVLLNLLKSLWGPLSSLHHLLLYSLVDCAVYSLMFHVVIESISVMLLLQVRLNLQLLCL